LGIPDCGQRIRLNSPRTTECLRYGSAKAAHSRNCHNLCYAENLEESEVLLKCRVLFVCADNGLHGPMAEAMLNWLDSEHFEARSAGTIYGELHPLTVEVMKEIGIDLGQKTPKSVNQLLNEEFDYVITLGRPTLSCDRKFACAEVVHWKFDDPCAPDDPERQLREFRTIRDQILQRLRLFVLVHFRSQNPSRPTTLSMNAASG
jgi:protein-tyrosine-phosphatase